MVVAAPQKELEASVAIPPRPRRWPKTFALIILWQTIALLFVEAVMYSAGIGEEEIFRLDKEIGFKHVPNKRIFWKQEGPGVYSYFDADGMREPNLTIAKPVGTYRVAVLGDSLVEGLQSEIEKTFGYRMGKELSKELHHPVEVLNFGNSGYSTAQEYLQLKKVWKYSPDLVLLGYSNRDIFENWSPPDETITNVRPYALRLPNGPLVVDNSSVTGWMRTPRAKFLMSIAWIREYSHIWGLVSAAETQFGHSNPAYRAISEFLTNPVKSLRGSWTALPGWLASIPQNTIKSLRALCLPPVHHDPARTQNAVQAVTQSAVKSDPAVNAATLPVDKSDPAVDAAALLVAKDAATQSAITKPPDTIPGLPGTQNAANKQRGVFVDLLGNTLGALLAEMKSESAKHGAKFCVVTMPSKSELCPAPGERNDAFALTYPQEVQLVKHLCQEDSIPIYDAETAMAQLSLDSRRANFYTNHLTPKGHLFVAKRLQPFIEKQIVEEPKP
jgi:lysophospholipase L1-like esterase